MSDPPLVNLLSRALVFYPLCRFVLVRTRPRPCPFPGLWYRTSNRFPGPLRIDLLSSVCTPGPSLVLVGIKDTGVTSRLRVLFTALPLLDKLKVRFLLDRSPSVTGRPVHGRLRHLRGWTPIRTGPRVDSPSRDGTCPGPTETRTGRDHTGLTVHRTGH